MNITTIATNRRIEVLIRAVPWMVILATLAGCAHAPADRAGGQPPVPSGAQAVSTRSAGALARLSEDITNPHLHVLVGLGHLEQALAGDRSHLAFAEVAFSSALSFDPGGFWPQLLGGSVALEQDRNALAVDLFAGAVLARPERWEPYYGLSLSAYRAGHHELAKLAASAMIERAPLSAEVLRNASYAHAGAGDESAVTFARQLAAAGDSGIERRIERVLLASSPQEDPGAPGVSERLREAVNQQITIDVAIILSSTLNQRIRGINLLDGLTAQYGYQEQRERRIQGGVVDRSRAIIQAIGIPQLTYSLNLFNDSSQWYQVLARPSLTAYLGRESVFFAGRQVNVQVSGVNLGSLQPIDIGVGLKVTPEEISADRVRFAVNASRSFLSANEVGTFSESLTTFRQEVSATAEVAFGQTLLLSSLSEDVRDASSSKTPLLGDVPVVNTVFNRRSAIQREEALIVLVTPRPVLQIETPRQVRSEAVDQLIRLWNRRIDPRSDLGMITDRIGRIRLLAGVERDDVPLRPLSSRTLLREAEVESDRLAAR